VSIRIQLPEARELEAELVFDSSALFHAAVADRLDVFGDLIDGRRCVAPASVFEEVRRAATRGRGLGGVVWPAWLGVVHVDGLDDLPYLFRWGELLGAGDHHRGEAAVLAYAQSRGAVAIVDDKEPLLLAKRTGLMAHGSLWLMTRACLSGRTSPAAVAGLIDALVAAGARYPCDGRTFRSWAERNGLPLGRGGVPDLRDTASR
jgi:predicted nucleic acid-binding protein